VTVIARHKDGRIVLVPGRENRRLLIDRAKIDGDRHLAELLPDEPVSAAEVIARMYLAAGRPACRSVSPFEDYDFYSDFARYRRPSPGSAALDPTSTLPGGESDV
jgi:hypothetical protein